MSAGFEVFLSIVISIGTIFYGWGQYRNGKSVAAQRSSQDADSTVSLLKTRADTFEAQLKDAQTEIAKQHDQIIRLEESNKHKDDQIRAQLEIISNRNPDLEKTLGDVRNFLEQLNKKIGNGNQLVIDAAHTAG